MSLKLKKTNVTRAYKGIIIEPKIRDFFTGRIWTRHHTPFPPEKIEKYIEQGFFKKKNAISTRIHSFGIIKLKRYQCNRCHNAHQQEFIEFDCARCEKKCVYCRHCINMGRMSMCTDLIQWKGPLQKSTSNHVLDWKGQFTAMQEKASSELIESLSLNRNHLIHAV